MVQFFFQVDRKKLHKNIATRYNNIVDKNTATRYNDIVTISLEKQEGLFSSTDHLPFACFLTFCSLPQRPALDFFNFYFQWYDQEKTFLQHMSKNKYLT